MFSTQITRYVHEFLSDLRKLALTFKAYNEDDQDDPVDVEPEQEKFIFRINEVGIRFGLMLLPCLELLELKGTFQVKIYSFNQDMKDFPSSLLLIINYNTCNFI